MISIVIFFVALASGGAFLKRQTVKDIGIAQAHILEIHLNQGLSATFALASVLWQQGSIDNFDALAKLRTRRLTATH
jgi:hypothetical protein